MKIQDHCCRLDRR